MDSKAEQGERQREDASREIGAPKDPSRAAASGRAARDHAEDAMDEASEESFPASDPPAWNPTKAGPPAGA